MENNTKFCTNCGQPIDANAMFCTGCGANQNAAAAADNGAVSLKKSEPVMEAPVMDAAPKSGSSNVFLSRILSPLIVVSIAFVMLITAFLPIAHIKTGTKKDDPYYKISAFNAVSFMFDSFKSVESEDFEDTLLAEKIELNEELLWEEIMDIESDDYDSYDELPGRIKRLMNKQFIYEMRSELQSDSTKTNLSLVVAGLTALLYVLASVAFFVFALIKLIKALTAKSDDAAERPISQSKLNMIFLAVPMVLAVAYFALRLGLSAVGIASVNMAVSGAATFTFVVVALAVIASVVLEIVFDIPKFLSAVKEKLMKLIGIGAAFTLAIALLISLSAPVLSATVSAKFGGRSNKKDLKVPLETSYFASLGMTEEEKEDAEEASEKNDKTKERNIERVFDYFATYTSKQVKDGKANTQNAEFVDTAAENAGFYKSNFLFGLIALLYLAAFGFTLYALWSCLVALVNGKKVALSLTLVNAIVVAVAVVLALIFSFVVNGALNGLDVKNYSLGLSFAAICSLLFAAGAKVCEVVFGNMANKQAAVAAPAEFAAPTEFAAPAEFAAPETSVSEENTEA